METCPPGYHVHNEAARSCYQFVAHYFDWYQAELYCMSAGGHLVALESDTENDFLSSYAEQHNGGLVVDAQWLAANAAVHGYLNWPNIISRHLNSLNWIP